MFLHNIALFCAKKNGTLEMEVIDQHLLALKFTRYIKIETYFLMMVRLLVQ